MARGVTYLLVEGNIVTVISLVTMIEYYYYYYYYV